MTNPQHTRPFNLEHARAGAPILCANGEGVELLKWDRKHTMCIVGVAHMDAAVRMWRADGTYAIREKTDYDLVMIPLGWIDGKPVFVGDEVIIIANNRPYVAHPVDREFDRFRWPAPAIKYPETQMDARELHAIYLANQTPTYYAGYEAIASAVLRHAVVGGYLVLPAVHDALKHEIEMLKRDRAGSETTAKGAEHAPAYVCPKTTMLDAELLLAADGSGKRMLAAQLRHVVNAGIQHAVDSGLVALPGKEFDDGDIISTIHKFCVAEKFTPSKVVKEIIVNAVKALQVSQPEIDLLKADLARNSRELGRAERKLEELGYRRTHQGEWRIFGGDPACFTGIVNVGTAYGNQRVIDYISHCIAVCEGRAARDTAIATTVVEECVRVATDAPNLPTFCNIIKQCNLATIIAGVKP